MPARPALRLLGMQVRTGCGDMLGHVVGASCWPDGTLREIRVRQPDGHGWSVEAVHIRSVEAEVQLKGPREGFHIAPLTPSRTPARSRARRRERGHGATQAPAETRSAAGVAR